MPPATPGSLTASRQPDYGAGAERMGNQMSMLTSSLLDFILGLLRDQEQASAFNDDPQRALQDAGLGDVCGADVQALVPMLSDYSPVGSGGGGRPHFERPEREHDFDRGRQHHGGDDDSYLAIEHIKHIAHNYHYDATTTIDASHNVWGDSIKVFGDDNVVATHGSVAAGDDVEDVSVRNTEVDGDGNATNGSSVRNEDSFNEFGDGNNATGDDATATGNVGLGNAVGSDASNENIDSFSNNGNTNDDGVQINSTDDFTADDIESNQADDGSVAGGGTIDNSEFEVGDVEVDVDVNNVHTENGDAQVQSPEAEQSNEGFLVADNVDLDNPILLTTVPADGE
jgi:hypothetical protein